MLACGMQLSAQSAEQTEEQPQTEADTLVCNHPMPQHLQASMPRRAAEAAACPVDSIVNFDKDGKVYSKTEYEYDASGYTVAEIKYQWIDGVKTGISRYRKYFTGSTATTIVNYQWSGTLHDWIGRDSTVLRYSGNLNTGSVSYMWENDGWRPQTEYVYEFNSAGKKTLSQYSKWDATAQALVYVDKSVWEYDEKGRSLVTAKWQYKDGQWVGVTNTVAAYNENGSKVLEAKYSGWENNDWKGTTKNTYAYNSANKVIEQVTYNWSKGWVESKKNVKDYSGSNITEDANYTWSDGAWKGTSRTTKTFDSGNVQSETAWAWDVANAKWVEVSMTEYAYSDSQKEITIGLQRVGDSWVNVWKRIYTYDSEKRIERDSTYSWHGDAWADSLYTSYTYDAKNINALKDSHRWDGVQWQATDSLTHEVEYVTIDGKEYTQSDVQMEWKQKSGKWAGKSKTLWEYDAAGNTTLVDVYGYSGNDWVHSSRREYAYKNNNSNLLILDVSMTWDNGHWKSNSSKTEYGFDEQGKRIMTALYKWNVDKSDWEGISKSEDVYDGSKVVRTFSHKWDYVNWGWAGEFMYEYSFDAKGREVERLIWRYNDEKADYVYETKYVYGFNSKGTQVQVETWQWMAEDEKWCQTTGEYSAYDEDSNGKLRLKLNRNWSLCEQTYYDSLRYYYACDPVFYTVTFNNWNDTALAVLKMPIGEMPAYPAALGTPEKTADAQYTYTFAGWHKEITAVAGEASYTATYSSTLNRYTVTFYDEDGTTKLWSGEFDYGTTPVYGGGTPEKTADAQYTYTFAGWDEEIAAVAGEASYTATYSSTLNRYTVTFYDEDGTTKLWSGEFDYGTTPVYGGSEPEKTADAQYTYTFAGWDKEIAAVSGEASYTATYSSTLNQYTVTFYDEDGTKILWKEVLDYGATPVYKGEKPMKEGNQQYSYSFMGWDEDIVPVTGDAVYKAVFMQNINKFTVTFRDADGVTELQSQNYEYGQVPVYEGVTPTKSGDAQYSYVFDGWDKEITAVTEYTVYTAQYKEVVNRYVVTFYDEDGTTVLWSDKFDYGAMAAYGGETPATTGDAQYSHVFKGWDKELAEVTGDASYTAQYEDVLNLYRVTFYDEDGETVLDSREWEYGSTPAYMGTTPVKAEDENNTYSFSGWDKELGVVTGEASYTASYTATAKTPTSIGGMQEAERKAVKVVENGVMYIIIDGVKYDAKGLIIDN